MSLTQEQPPVSADDDLREFLSRRFIEVENELNKPSKFPERREMPYKPQVGDVHYFGNPADHSYDAIISTEGFWGLTSLGWIKLGGSMDYNLDVLRGLVPGHSMVSISGHDAMLSTTRTTVHPTGETMNIDQSSIHATPDTVKIASTSGNDDVAGTGVLTIMLIGLDAAGDPQSEVITMTGQTEVTSSLTYSAVLNILCLSWGSTTWNEGNLWVGSGTFTAGIPAVRFMSADIRSNRSMTAYYVVPAGHQLYLRQIILTIASSNKDIEFFIESSTNGINWITQAIFGLESGAAFTARSITAPGIAAGTAIRVEALALSSGSDTTVIIGAELIED